MKYFFSFIFISFLASCSALQRHATLVVENPIDLIRQNEVVEVSWNKVKHRLPKLNNRKIVVLDNNGNQLPFQLITNGTDSVESLIFLASFSPKEQKLFILKNGKSENFEPMVYGRLVPERKDDFAWENNKVAYRFYGPALQATGEISNGMDFWAKKTSSLIINKWYRDDLAKTASYHKDHGEGLDFYKVGRTLGVGMTAPFLNDTLCLGNNFTSAQILDCGPIRITFKLQYSPFLANGKMISETRVISLDAYQQLNRISNVFIADTTNISIATGIVLSKSLHHNTFFSPDGIMAYELPTDKINLTIYTAVINQNGFQKDGISNNHFIGINNYFIGNQYIYYVGAGWSQCGFKNFDEWKSYINKQTQIINNPLKVKVK